MKKRVCTTILAVALILLTGCHSSVQEDQPLGQDRGMMTPTLSGVNLALPTNEAIQAQTPTAIPTVTRPKSVRDLLRTNNDCDLPCFLGIKLGVTNWQDAIDSLKQLGAEGVSGKLPNNIEYFTSNIMLDDVSLLINLYKKEDAVGAIMLTVSNKGTALGLSSDFKYYSLANTFQKSGSPSRLLLKLDYPAEGSSQLPDYNFWVMYDELGLQENYLGPTGEIGDTSLCPEQTFNQLVSYLYLPDLKFLPWGEDISEINENSTDLDPGSPSELYESVTQSGEPACITIRK